MIKKTLQIGSLTLLLAGISVQATEPDRTGMKGSSMTDATIKVDGDKKTQFDLDKVKMDPLAFFESLVERYRGLSSYRDSTRLTQVTQRLGEKDLRTITSFICEIEDGELTVLTPAGQAREGFGLNLPIRKTDAMKEMELRYRMWLAPHMAMKFAEEPLEILAEGIEEGFTPTSVEHVLDGDKPMVHLELRSGDGLSEICDAEFDFYINPESMLIEKIESVQHMPDGSDYSTTLEITPEPQSEEMLVEEEATFGG